MGGLEGDLTGGCLIERRLLRHRPLAHHRDIPASLRRHRINILSPLQGRVFQHNWTHIGHSVRKQCLLRMHRDGRHDIRKKLFPRPSCQLVAINAYSALVQVERPTLQA